MSEKYNEFLQSSDIDKIFFYYKDSPITKNIYTACLLINKKEKIIEARGVSICSLLDTYKKSKGKSKAYGRAIKALFRKQNFFKINGFGREDESTIKTLTITNEDEYKDFLDKKLSELLVINQFPIIEEIKQVKKDKEIRKYKVEIPSNYPILKTNEEFSFKSEFRPKPANSIEIDMLKNL
jgi:hypothetical protein